MRQSFIKSIFKSCTLLLLICAGIFSNAQAQYKQASWWFGVAGGVNYNMYRGSTQQLNSALTVPVAFHDGKGIGLFAGPVIEFHPAHSFLGFMLQAGYDGRRAEYEQVTTPCNCPADLTTDLSYITIEPSLRIAPFKSDFYLYAGPRFAFNMNKQFTYQLGINPATPAQPANPEVKGDFDNIKKTIISGQVGMGYDIWISSRTRQSQVVLSPFVAYQPYFGQSPRTVETWNISTVRAGLALKF